MSNGDRINAIKQDWVEDNLIMLREISGDVKLELKSLSKMSSNDLNRLHSILIDLKEKICS